MGDTTWIFVALMMLAVVSVMHLIGSGWCRAIGGVFLGLGVISLIIDIVQAIGR